MSARPAQPGAGNAAGRGRRVSSFGLGIAVVAGAVTAGSALLASVTGNFGIPHNDDWSFSLTTLDFLRSGHWHYFNWGQMPLFGQVAAATPFTAVLGIRETALQAMGLAAAAVAVIAFALLGRRLLTRTETWLGIVGLLAFPGYAALSTSYMTDLPALAGQLLCLLAGLAANRRCSLGWLVGSEVIGVWAFSVRQQSFAAMVAVAVVAYLGGTERGWRRRVVAVAGSALAGCVAIEIIRRLVPDSQSIPLGPDSWLGAPGHIAVSLLQEMFTLGLLLSPVVVLRARDLWVGRSSRARQLGWAVAGLIAIGFAAEPATGHPYQITIGNYLGRAGSYAMQPTGVSPAMPEWVWFLVQAVAIVGGAAILGEICHRGDSLRRPFSALIARGPAKAVVAIFAVGYVAFLVVEALPGTHLYDRYALPLVLPGCLLLAGVRRADPAAVSVRAPRIAVGLTAAFVLAISWVVSVATLTRDATVWRTADRIVAEDHVVATDVNAGLAWDGWQAARPANPERITKTRAFATEKYSQLFSGSTSCVIVVAGSDAGDRGLIFQQRRMIDGYGLPGSSGTVNVYRRPSSCGPG